MFLVRLPCFFPQDSVALNPDLLRALPFFPAGFYQACRKCFGFCETGFFIFLNPLVFYGGFAGFACRRFIGGLYAGGFVLEVLCLSCRHLELLIFMYQGVVPFLRSVCKRIISCFCFLVSGFLFFPGFRTPADKECFWTLLK